VLTQHNDIGRTGLNPNETILTPQSVGSSSTHFGKLFTLAVDGQVMAQPLYYHGVVFVATQGGSVYAFDATSGALRWRAVLIPALETQGSETDYSCFDISTIRGTSAPVANGNVGITGTPVIDDQTGTLYAVVRSKTTGATPIHYFRLHALDTTTGAEKLNSPVAIQGTVSGSGAGSVGGSLSFDASLHHQRAGLLNVNGKIYIAFAGLCDAGNYHGWVIGYRGYDGTAASLTQTSMFATSPNAFRSGIWMSGAGLAADLDPQSQSERIYPVTGNGPTPAGASPGAVCSPIDINNPDYRDSVLQLTLNSAGALTVNDFFTPSPELTNDTFCNTDKDVGSGGALLLPYSAFPQPLLVQQGKSGAMYVLNREQLGTSSSDGTQTIQPPIGGFPLWGLPAYWNNNIYVWGAHGALTQYQFSSGGILSQMTASSNQSTYGIGTTPSVSSLGNTNGIVWGVDWNQGISTFGTPNPQILYAYDATNVSNTLWSSAQTAPRDSAMTQQKSVVPTIAAGEVFLADGSHVEVYGILNGTQQTIVFTAPASPVTYPVAPLALSASSTSGLTVMLSVLSGPATVSGTNLTITGAGTVVVAAVQGGDSTYAPAQQITQTIAVNKGSQAISFTAPSSFTYPASPIILNGTATSGLPVTYSVISGPATVSNSTLIVTGVGTVVVAADQVGNVNYNAASEIRQTIVVSQAAAISAVLATGITASTATITWTTTQPTTTQVEYGTTASYGTLSSGDGSLSTSHYLTLFGLTAGTTYNYAAMSTNSTGASAVSQNFTFTTQTSTAIPGLPVLASNPAFPANLKIAAFATGLNYPSGMSQLPDGSLLVATSNPASNVLYGYATSTLQVYRITTANGVAGAPTMVFGGSAGPATGMASVGSLVAIATGTNSGSQILILQAGNQGTLTQLGSIAFTYPAGTWEHDSHTVALRGVPGQAGFYQLIFGVGSQVNNLATPASTQVGTSGMISQNLAADSLYSVQFSVVGPTIAAAPAIQLGSGLRNPFALAFAPNGDIYLGDNGQDVGLTNVATSADAFDVIPAGTTTVLNFGFPNTFPDPATGLEVGPPTGVTSPIAAFTPLNGQNSQGVSGMALSPGSFPSSLRNGLVLGFFGAGYGSGSFWDPVIYLDRTTGQYFHFIEGGQFGVGPLISMLSTDSALYIADFGTTGSGGTIYAVSVTPVITSVTATAISPTTATVTWTTDQASTSLVNYGTTTAYGLQSALATTLVTAHSVTLTGLTPGANYNFDVVSGYSAFTPSTSGNFTFATPATPAPVISAVASYPVTNTTAGILWTTDQNTTSQVNYGATTAYGSQTPLNTTLGLYHNVPLTGLTPGTTYNYQVVSINSSGVSSTSANFSFTTSGTAPLIFSAVTAIGITNTTATITWTTNVPSTTEVAYGTTSAYGSLSALNATLGTAHSVTLTGLTPGTTYNYAALSTTASVPNAVSANFTFTTTGGVAPVLSAVSANAITSTSATINWTTDQASTTQVFYGTTIGYGSQSPLNPALVTSHSVTLTGLTANTTYNFAAASTSSANFTGTSANLTFTTTSSSTPTPVISAVAAWPVAATTATILWATDQNTTSLVNYGTTPAYGFQSALVSTLSPYHAVPLPGLTPGSTYNFSVVSTNFSGVSSTSANFTFTTSGTAPLTFSAVTATGITSTSATITWTTNVAATTQVAYGTTTAYSSLSALNSTQVAAHSVTLTGLIPGTTYNYAALSTNSSAPSGASGNFTFTTSPGGPAPVISAVTATSITSTSATITWTTDQASSSQVNYGTTTAYGSQSPLNTTLVTAQSVTLTGLTPGTTYNFDVFSANGSNTPATSGNFTFATTAASAPLISLVTATSITSTSATITWTTDQAASSQVNYGTTTAYGSQSPLNTTLVTAHSVTLTGLSPGTAYNFDVFSANGSNTPATSGNFTFATTAASAPVISAVTAISITSTSATITWTSDQASSSQVNYGTTTAYGSQSPLNNTLVAAHSVTLTGLTPGTTYNFDVFSANGSNTPVTSGNFTFATTAASAPVISAVTATSITSTSATITWTTDQASSSQVNYGTTTAYGSQSPLNTTLVAAHSVTLTGLTPATT
jgi:glucose/arabinose dehydrogenase